MDKIASSATTASTTSRIAYAPPAFNRPATRTTNPVRPEPGFDAARQRAQERTTLDIPRDSSYQPDRSNREQTFGARFGQVGVTLDIKA